MSRYGDLWYSLWVSLYLLSRWGGTGKPTTDASSILMWSSHPRIVPSPQRTRYAPLSMSVQETYTRGTPSVLKLKSGRPRLPSITTHSGGVKSTNTPREYVLERNPTPF